MKSFIIFDIIALCLIMLMSCSRQITGKVTSVKNNVVTVGQYRFLVYDPRGIVVGKTYTFKPTVNRRKVNSKKLPKRRPVFTFGK